MSSRYPHGGRLPRAVGMVLASLSLLSPTAAPGAPRSPGPRVAFFYGKPVPVAELCHFDWVVVQPDNLDAGGLTELRKAGVHVFAYLSLGEAPPGAADPAWAIGRNAGWGSVILDPAAPGWRARVEERASALSDRGFRGLFLDTLDSYVAALRAPAERRAAAAALASLVRAIHQRHPELELFFNRGFEILGEVGPLAAGLAAESLFCAWNAEAKRYVEVPVADRQWLSDRLRAVRDALGIPVVVIDYLPPERRAAARDVARRIADLGFVPWVANAALDSLGLGLVEVIPRRVLLLYDGAEAPDLARSLAHRLAALPIEHLGFVPEYVDVRRGLPHGRLAGRYAGIVTWFEDDELPDEIGYPAWLSRQMADGLRVAILGHLGFSAASGLLSRLGLAPVAGEPARAVRIAHRDAMVGLEAEPRLRSRGLTRLRAVSRDVTIRLRVEAATGSGLDQVVTAPWGGLALDPYLLDAGYEGHLRWILDPFAFLEETLRVRPGPALDVTTENGARLLVVTADGRDPSAGGSRPPADVVAREVLERFPVATTVALPVEELLPSHSRSDARARDERAAAHLVALPTVELAARPLATDHDRAGAATPRLSVQDAVDGIARLPGCASARPRAFFWPCGTTAAAGAIARLDRGGLASIGSAGQAGLPALAALAPTGLPVGDGFETYLPGLNEESGADLSARGILDPAHVAALAALAETPRRLKPIGIHYPFWLAARPSALRSLAESLRWALAQRTLSLWASEYASRIAGFHEATMARRIDGSYEFRGLGELRTVRVPRALGWPDLGRSRGVAGVAEHGGDLYVGLAPVDRPVLVFERAPSRGPFLAWSNATLLAWARKDRSASLRLRGHGPIELEVGGVRGVCALTVHGRILRSSGEPERQVFSLPPSDTGDALLRCQDG